MGRNSRLFAFIRGKKSFSRVAALVKIINDLAEALLSRCRFFLSLEFL